MNYATLIVNGTRCAVFNSLRHIVNVDVFTEHLAGVAVFRGYRRTCKSNECRIGKGITDDTSVTYHDSGFGFALLIFAHDHALIHAVLATMGFVCHNHDVASGGQRFLAFLELKHGGEDDAVG